MWSLLPGSLNVSPVRNSLKGSPSGSLTELLVTASICTPWLCSISLSAVQVCGQNTSQSSLWPQQQMSGPWASFPRGAATFQATTWAEQ